MKVNRVISSDRIIVENVFGRVCGLWTVMSTKWKWIESSSDSIFKLFLGLTNFHIRWSLLREGDGQLYWQIKTRWYRIAESQAERIKHVQESTGKRGGGWTFNFELDASHTASMKVSKWHPIFIRFLTHHIITTLIRPDTVSLRIALDPLYSHTRLAVSSPRTF